MKLDTDELTVEAVYAVDSDISTKHLVLCASRQHGWDTAEKLAKRLMTAVPLVSTIPDALTVLQALVQPPAVVLAPHIVFMYPGWACVLDCPTKVHATMPMHDEEIFQFLGRFNRFNPKTGNVGDNASVGKIARFSAIAH